MQIITNAAIYSNAPYVNVTDSGEFPKKLSKKPSTAPMHNAPTKVLPIKKRVLFEKFAFGVVACFSCNSLLFCLGLKSSNIADAMGRMTIATFSIIAGAINNINARNNAMHVPSATSKVAMRVPDKEKESKKQWIKQALPIPVKIALTISSKIPLKLDILLRTNKNAPTAIKIEEP